jgi:hypothetical protein
MLAVAAAAAAGCGGAAGGMAEQPGPACQCVVGGLWVTVVDASTRDVVPDAAVSIAGPACSGDACSCQRGSAPERQFLCVVPDGTFTVTAQASGYAAGSADATVASSGPPGCHCQLATRVTVALSR